MGDLTANFSRAEFECKCGCGQNQVEEMLVDRLQLLRDLIQVPITVSSGIRCATHNALMGGSANSQHLYGKAADIFTDLVPMYEVHDKAKILFGDGGIGVYAGDDEFLHLDIRDGSARWGQINGVAVGYHAAVAALEEGDGDAGMA